MDIKKEYTTVLEKMEELIKIFNEMKEETVHLKKMYEKNPQDQNLLEEIKLQEENYKMLYEEFLHLNKKAHELKDRKY